jgi:hypothetical protein
VAVMMLMRWEGVTPEQYDEALERVGWERDFPTGGIFHVAAFADDGLRVTDVWESAEDFQRFADDRLMPVIQELGIENAPEVTILPAHRVFAPGYEHARA